MRGSGTAVVFLLRQALRQCGCGVLSPQKILHKRSAEAFLRDGFLHTHFNTVSRDEWQGATVKAAFYISKHFCNFYFPVRLPVGVLTFYFFLSIMGHPTKQRLNIKYFYNQSGNQFHILMEIFNGSKSKTPFYRRIGSRGRI